jgi:hypothetical protein|tara:strand:- start:694 stop:879 length:186 start_codon:yes stop_codon:yes gene_type:complete
MKMPNPIVDNHPYERLWKLLGVEREVCKYVRGCELINGTCPTCLVEMFGNEFRIVFLLYFV